MSKNPIWPRSVRIMVNDDADASDDNQSFIRQIEWMFNEPLVFDPQQPKELDRPDPEYVAALERIAIYAAEFPRERAVLQMPPPSERACRDHAFLRMRRECAQEEAEWLVNRKRAAQAKSASKKPRNRKSPYPAWMQALAKHAADRRKAQPSAEVAYSAIDAMCTEAAAHGMTAPKLPSRQTVTAWIDQHRAGALA